MSNQSTIKVLKYAVAVLELHDVLKAWYADFKAWAEQQTVAAIQDETTDRYVTSSDSGHEDDGHMLAGALETVAGHIRSMDVWACKLDLDDRAIELADAEFDQAKLVLLHICPAEISAKHVSLNPASSLGSLTATTAT